MNTRKLNWRDYLVEILVGMFFFTALIGLAYYTVILSGNTFLKDKYAVDVKFEQISNLRVGDPVLLRGVSVGSVESFRLDPEHVIATIKLNNGVEIFEGCKVKIESSSMLGGHLISIIQGDVKGKLIEPGMLLQGRVEVDMATAAGEILNDLRESGIIDKVNKIADNVEIFTNDLNSKQGTLRKLIDDATLYEESQAFIADLREFGTKLKSKDTTLGKLMNDDGKIHDDIKAIVKNTKDVTDKINKGEGTLAKLINGDSLHKDVEMILADVKNFTKSLRNKDSSISKLLDDKGELYKHLASAFEHADKVFIQLEKATANLQNGKGTLGKLINDPSLYKEAKETLSEVKGAIEDMRETSPVSTFGSFIFGAL